MSVKINNTNQVFYLLVVVILGMAVLGSMVGIIYLSTNSKSIPESLIVLGSVSIGALGSLFSNQTGE